jgi:hypothetical protein
LIGGGGAQIGNGEEDIKVEDIKGGEHIRRESKTQRTRSMKKVKK